jgi:glutamine synthetase
VATPKDVLHLMKESGAEIVDFRFCDLPGLMQHFSVPAAELTEGLFEDGIGFDGSSIRGFQEIQESDMLLVPDPDTAYMDPFTQHRTLNINCFVKDPVTGRWQPRPALRREEGRAVPEADRIADTSYWGPEASSHLRLIRFDQNQHEGYYHIDADEGVWNSGAEQGGKNLGYRPRSRATSRSRRWTSTRTYGARWSST